MVRKFLDYGFSWVAMSSDLGLMVGRAQEYLGKLRGTLPAANKEQSAY